MSEYFFEPKPPVGAYVKGGGRKFPVRRIYCVGRNYAEHAQEMGFSDRDPPFFFCKPADALVNVKDGAVALLDYPSRTQNYQHEIELVVAIGRSGSDIPVESALEHVFGYAVGLDMTKRDAQMQMREQGRPWEIGKAFDHSAVMGEIRPVEKVGHLNSGQIWVDVDGERKQSSDLSKLIWNVAETISHLSTWFHLEPGDLIFSGTPAGVGQVKRGQLMEGGIDGLGLLRAKVNIVNGGV